MVTDKRLGIRRNALLQELWRNKVMFLMITPTLLFFLINSYAPMIGAYYAFTNFNFEGGLFHSPFVGLKNFEFLWHSGILVRLTMNTIGYNLAFILIGNFLAISFSILLNEIGSMWFKKITQSVMFLPYFISYVLLSAIAFNMFNFDSGFVNSTLKSIGQAPIDIYGTPWIWVILIILFYLWKQLGYSMVIYLAAIAGISEEYYEAAKIDGASQLQRIWYITMPMLTPTFMILLLFSLGSIMKGQFDLFYQLVGNNGMLYNATDIIDTYVYRSLKVTFDIGMATAAGLYQSLFGLILILTVNYWIRRKSEEYALF